MANSGQEDCDGDGTGDACDGFNGTVTFLGYDLYLLDWFLLDDWCWGDWHYEWWLGFFFERDYYLVSPCSGSSYVQVNEYTFYSTFLTATYDPWYCSYYAYGPAPQGRDSGRKLASTKGFRVELRDGQLVLVTPDGTRTAHMPVQSGRGGVHQQNGKLYFNGPQGDAELKLDFAAPDATELRKLPDRH